MALNAPFQLTFRISTMTRMCHSVCACVQGGRGVNVDLTGFVLLVNLIYCFVTNVLIGETESVLELNF